MRILIGGINISKNYFSEEGFITVPNATKAIVQKYNIMDRELEGRIYRTLLDFAHKGEFRGRRYKNEKSRMWEIGEEVIPVIEKQFNLIKISTNEVGNVQASFENDNNTLNVIRTLVNSCLNNRLTKEQCFDIISDLISNK